jgi:hypothetical protein
MLAAQNALQLEVPAMKQFQKIAIGLLGLTNPEMFIPRPKPGATSTTNIEPAAGRRSTGWLSLQEGRAARALRALKFLVTALAIGSRTVPLADNSQLRHDLRASARLLYGSDEG